MAANNNNPGSGLGSENADTTQIIAERLPVNMRPPTNTGALGNPDRPITGLVANAFRANPIKHYRKQRSSTTPIEFGGPTYLRAALSNIEVPGGTTIRNIFGPGTETGLGLGGNTTCSCSSGIPIKTTYIVVGANPGGNTVYISTDNGASWRPPTDPIPYPANGFGQDVFFGNGRWIINGGVGGAVAPASTLIFSDDNGDGWRASSTQLFNTFQGFGVHYGADRWIACGFADPVASSIIISTDNGVTWRQPNTTPLPLDLGGNNAFYSSEHRRWVAVGATNTGQNIVFSDDNGETWTASNGTPFTADGFGRAVHYANNRWVAVGFSPTNQPVLYSDDNGVNWTAATDDGGGSPFGVGGEGWGVYYGNGRWVAVGQHGQANSSDIIYSDDNGTTWRPAAGNPFGNNGLNEAAGRDVVFNRGLWVAVGANRTVGDENKNVLLSSNGIEWTTVNQVLPSNNNVGANGVYFRNEPSPCSHCLGTPLMPNSLVALREKNHELNRVGDHYPRAAFAGDETYAVNYTEDVLPFFVAVGQTGPNINTTGFASIGTGTGLSWQPDFFDVPAADNDENTGVAIYENNIVLVGASPDAVQPTVYVSRDLGKTLVGNVLDGTGRTGIMIAVATDGTNWVGVGKTNSTNNAAATIDISTTATIDTAWTRVTTVTTSTLRAIAYHNNIWVTVGATNTVLGADHFILRTTTDQIGTLWTVIGPFDIAGQLNCVATNGDDMSGGGDEVWMVGGTAEDEDEGHDVAFIATSTDRGLTWSDNQLTLTAPSTINGIATSGTTWLAVGSIEYPANTFRSTLIIKSTTAGATWSPNKLIITSSQLSDIKHNNGIWVAVGATAAEYIILVSKNNGEHWTRVTDPNIPDTNTLLYALATSGTPPRYTNNNPCSDLRGNYKQCVSICDPELKAKAGVRYSSAVNTNKLKPKYYGSSTDYLASRCSTYDKRLKDADCLCQCGPGACAAGTCPYTPTIKDNNPAFGVRGGVPPSNRITRLKYNTVTRYNNSHSHSIYDNFIEGVGAAVAYSETPTVPFVLKTKTLPCVRPPHVRAVRNPPSLVQYARLLCPPTTLGADGRPAHPTVRITRVVSAAGAPAAVAGDTVFVEGENLDLIRTLRIAGITQTIFSKTASLLTLRLSPGHIPRNTAFGTTTTNDYWAQFAGALIVDAARFRANGDTTATVPGLSFLPLVQQTAVHTSYGGATACLVEYSAYLSRHSQKYTPLLPAAGVTFDYAEDLLVQAPDDPTDKLDWEDLLIKQLNFHFPQNAAENLYVFAVLYSRWVIDGATDTLCWVKGEQILNKWCYLKTSSGLFDPILNPSPPAAGVTSGWNNNTSPDSGSPQDYPFHQFPPNSVLSPNLNEGDIAANDPGDTVLAMIINNGRVIGDFTETETPRAPVPSNTQPNQYNSGGCWFSLPHDYKSATRYYFLLKNN